MTNVLTKSCVKVTTGNEIQIVNYPEDTGCSGSFVREQLGSGCEYWDEVRPNRLYNPCPAYYARSGNATQQNPIARVSINNFGFHYPLKPCYDGGNILMLVDDNGYAKGLPDNLIASWLYGTDVNGNYIKGNVLFVGCTYAGEFSDYCGISHKELRRLAAKLYKLKTQIESK